MSKNPMREGDTHHHIWLPWGSEVDDQWLPLTPYVHVKCIGYDKRAPCKAVAQLTRYDWTQYRNSLSKYQEVPDAKTP